MPKPGQIRTNAALLPQVDSMDQSEGNADQSEQVVNDVPAIESGEKNE